LKDKEFIEMENGHKWGAQAK